MQATSQNTVEHFDESEVREIEIDNKAYPESGQLKGIKKPPKALRIRGNLPPNRKIIAISGSRKTTKQAFRVRRQNRQNARATRIYNRHWTCQGLRRCCC